jgi:hypothetical protein
MAITSTALFTDGINGMPQNPPVGDVRELSLPDEALTRILSHTPHPLREEQLLKKGISPATLGRACKCSIDPLCIEILLAYEVPLESIAARTDSEIQKELKLLLDNDFTLLQKPADLDAFLGKRLKEDSWWAIADACKSVVEVSEARELIQMLQLIEKEKAKDVPEKGLSSRTRATQKAVEFVKNNRHFFQQYPMQRDGKRLVFCEGSHYCVPFRLLANPPKEVLEEIRKVVPEAYTRLDISADTIPSGIELLSWVSDLRTDASTLPPSVGSLSLDSLEICRSRGLKQLPLSLKKKRCLHRFKFVGSTGEAQIINELVDQPLKVLQMDGQSGQDRAAFDLPQSLAEKSSLEVLDIQPCSRQLLEKIRGEELKTLIIRAYPAFDSFPDNLLKMNHLEELIFCDMPKAQIQDKVLLALKSKRVKVRYQKSHA